MMPSEKSVAWPSAPPEKALIRPKSEPVSLSWPARKAGSIPGIGMWWPKRKTSRRPRVYRILRRVSGILNSWRKWFCTACFSFGSGRLGLRFAALLVEHDRAAAGLLDLLQGGLGELLRAHGQLLLELAVAEHLEERRELAGEVAREHRIEVHRRAV